MAQEGEMDETTREALGRSFGPEAVRQKKGQGNRTMDYVSHGMVTKRLNDAAPDWHAEMIERWITETNGALHCLGGVMRLTIGDVTREEAGGPTRQGTLADDLKNTYSDCLKRCAMRFGVALDMWESAEENDEDAAYPPPGRTLAEADRSGVGHGRRDTAHPPPAFTRPRETPAAAPQPASVALAVLTEEQEKVIAQAWDMAEAGDSYGATKALVLTLKGAASEDEWREINRRWFTVRVKHYPMTVQAAQPAAYAG